MSTPARKRLMRDFKRLQTDPPQGVNGTPCSDNIMMWNAVIFGPEDTPWDGGTFRLTMQFSEEYPNKPPVVKFKSAMFHPNIYADGAICLDILQNQWSPIYDVSAVLTSIQSLLCDPNPNSPANSEAARLYGDDRREYDRRVRGAVEASLMQEETAAGAGAAGKKRPASAAAGAAAAASGGAPSVKKERKVEAAAAAAAPAPAPAAEKKEAEATKAQEEAEVTPATEAKAEAAAAPAAAPAAAKAEAAAAAAAPPPAGA